MSRVLVFGGTGGIGSAVCDALAPSFDTIDVVDVREPAESVVPSAGKPSKSCRSYHRVDLADDAARDSWMQRYLADNGVPDATAWCVGVYPRRDIRDYSTLALRDVVETNLIAALALLPPLLRAAVETAQPLRIVVVGSQAGVTGGLDVPYAASKAGLVAAVKSIAREYARHSVTANVVSPGPVETPMATVMGDERRKFYEAAIPLGRYSTAGEVAAVVSWLLTQAPEAVNGTVIDVDGGLVRR